MKKIVLAVLAVFVLSVSSYALKLDLNLKAGVDFTGKLGGKYQGTVKVNDDSESTSKLDVSGDTSGGMSFFAEALIPVNKALKLGAGFGYLPPIRVSSLEIDNKKIEPQTMDLSFVPIYAAVQLNPINSVPEVFFKGNIGFALAYMTLKDVNISVTGFDDKNETLDLDSAGLYLELATGYEFGFGLILQLAYTYIYVNTMSHDLTIHYSTGYEYSLKDEFTDISYSKLGITLGYKFKLGS
jgi:hypothetical protein